MITVYLDHNVIDGFDKGETAYLAPLFANKGVLPIISLASVDEIFRGRDETRSRRNIESLKRLGVRYIHSGPDDSHMSISELDYENMHQKWVKMQVIRKLLSFILQELRIAQNYWVILYLTRFASRSYLY